MVLKRTEICFWWGGGIYLYDIISVSSRLSEVPLVWAELLVPDELLVPEGMVVLVVDSDVPSSIRWFEVFGEVHTGVLTLVLCSGI